MSNAAPGDGTFASIDPGDVKIPLPITILITIANASMVPKLRANVPPCSESEVLEGLVAAAPYAGSWRLERSPWDSSLPFVWPFVLDETIAEIWICVEMVISGWEVQSKRFVIRRHVVESGEASMAQFMMFP